MLRLLYLTMLLLSMVACQPAVQQQELPEKVVQDSLPRGASSPVVAPSISTLSFDTLKNDTWKLFGENSAKESFSMDTSFTGEENTLYRQAVKIGNLFNANRKHAVVIYAISDTASALTLLEYQPATGHWNKVYENPSITSKNAFWQDPVIHLEDVNNDRTNDLRLLCDEGCGMFCFEQYHLWLYDRKNNRFIHIPEYSEINVPEHENNCIYSYSSAGCADMSMYFATYRWKGYRILREQEIFCDCCESPCVLEITDYDATQQKHERKIRANAASAHKFIPAYWREAVRRKLKD